MMQEMQSFEAKDAGQKKRVSNQSFAVLLALARRSLTIDELRASLGTSGPELKQTLDRLRSDGMVVDSLEVEHRFHGLGLCLTGQGERTLLREMEQMCELPER